MTDLASSIYGNKGVNPDAFLGILLFYRAQGVRLPHADGIELFNSFNLSDVAKPLPKSPKDVDVFARVMSDHPKKEVEGTKENLVYLIRPISKTIRAVVKERVNKKGEKLGYKTVTTIRWSSTGLSTEDVDPDDDGIRVASDAIAEYRRWRGCLNSYALREWVRESILSLQAIPLKNGVYFLTNDALESISRIEEFCFKVPGNIRLHTLPVIDTDKQRTLVEEAFESDVLGAMEDLRSEAAHWGTEGISQRRYTGLMDRFESILGKAKLYESTLDNRLASVEGASAMLTRELTKLAGKVTP